MQTYKTKYMWKRTKIVVIATALILALHLFIMYNVLVLKQTILPAICMTITTMAITIYVYDTAANK